MVRGYVTSFDARRGVGFLRSAGGEDRLPFTARDADGTRLQEGDAVEYKVTGGKAGVIAYAVRRVA